MYKWSVLFISFNKHMVSFTTVDFKNVPCRFCRQPVLLCGYRRLGRRHPKRPGMAQVGIITPQSGVPFIKLMTLMENWLIQVMKVGLRASSKFASDNHVIWKYNLGAIKNPILKVWNSPCSWTTYHVISDKLFPYLVVLKEISFSS